MIIDFEFYMYMSDTKHDVMYFRTKPKGAILTITQLSTYTYYVQNYSWANFSSEMKELADLIKIEES